MRSRRSPLPSLTGAALPTARPGWARPGAGRHGTARPGPAGRDAQRDRRAVLGLRSTGRAEGRALPRPPPLRTAPLRGSAARGRFFPSPPTPPILLPPPPRFCSWLFGVSCAPPPLPPVVSSPSQSGSFRGSLAQGSPPLPGGGADFAGCGARCAARCGADSAAGGYGSWRSLSLSRPSRLFSHPSSPPRSAASPAERSAGVFFLGGEGAKLRGALRGGGGCGTALGRSGGSRAAPRCAAQAGAQPGEHLRVSPAGADVGGVGRRGLKPVFGVV